MTQLDPTEGSYVVETTPRNGLKLLTLDRPQKRNALTNDMLVTLAACLHSHMEDKSVRVTIITGAGTAFCAGADIAELAEGGLEVVACPTRMAAWSSIEAHPKPLICAVNGPAYGAGNELAMLADIVIAGASAHFAQPEVTIGGIAGDGGTQRLCRLIGPRLATRMLLTGAPIDARQALMACLVTEVVDDDKLIDAALAIASEIASASPTAVQTTKRLIGAVHDTTLSAGLRVERAALYEVFTSADRIEGQRAFLEKRPPQWRDA